jgi:predicted HD phosphohydrolase
MVSEFQIVLASLAGVFDGEEPVDELSHAVQCALLAQRAGADGGLVVAALFHDVARSPLVNGLAPGLPHEIAGATWLLPRLGERVAWLVAAHTAAKVYLMETEPGYGALLTPESRKSAELQRVRPREDLEANDWWSDALRLRRWDDSAKDPAFIVSDIAELVAFAERQRID